MDTNEIRSYGPGKFNTILDAYVYGVSMNGGGCDAEVGESCNSRWYGLMRNGRTIFQDHDPMLESLNEAEREMLTSAAGVILTEDSQGFVYVEYFDTMAELDAKWSEIEASEQTEDDDADL